MTKFKSTAVGIMRDNINRVAERGERLDTLQDKVRFFLQCLDTSGSNLQMYLDW